MIANTVLELGRDSLFLTLPDAIDRCETLLKIEGFNPAGSIKLLPAIEMVSQLERLGSIAPGKHTLIEPSSGNLGDAPSIVSKQRGYRFICVTDPNITARSHRQSSFE
ncbi:pyridoxal-phosphate dependent enzyme [Bradyrhizobium ontarionense]|uniref:pyridoxal-phosphate dependent enzyme n=1 Tax=Bradyrhizobium ontarionense TaxID=2898149 RepID=UPI003CE588B2